MMDRSPLLRLGRERLLRHMADFHIGDRVMLRGRVYFIRGFSPMSVAPPRVQLEDAETGEEIEADADDLQTLR